MELYNRILQNEKYRLILKNIEELETDREFCKHGIEHLLDVARIAYIDNLENGYGIDKDVIYSTALLHDIGRSDEKALCPHEETSAVLAKPILVECGCDEDAIDSIIVAIANHGNKSIAYENNLSGIIYRADKLSRRCMICASSEQCNWSTEKKNNILAR